MMSEFQKIWAYYEGSKFVEERLKVDNALKEGIKQGLPFAGYQQMTNCPESLRERYNELAEQAKAAEERKRDPFLEGFLGENGSYIPREPRR